MQQAQTVPQQIQPLGFIARWWQNWKRRAAATRELSAFGDREVAHLAHDLGISPSELRTLAGRWPDSADLLGRRMGALGLDTTQIAHEQPEVLRDLQRVCGQCRSENRCEHDLHRDEKDASWRTYCPNVATLDVLRSQERDRRWMRRGRKWRRS